MSHMPEGLLHEQAEAVFRETGMGPRELQAKVAEYGAVIEGAVDVNLELQVQRSALLKGLEAAKGFIEGQRASDNLGISNHTLDIISGAMRRTSA